jgi:hypothetical protein
MEEQKHLGFGIASFILAMERIGDERQRKRRIAVTGSAIDEVGIGNELNVSLELDQTFLRAIINQLDDLIKAYPVVGNLSG